MSRIKPWTDEEVGWLLDNADLPARVIAEELGRGVDGVKHMRRRLAQGHVPLNTWTESEDAFILDNPQMTQVQVANHLGRTVNAVSMRRSKLRKLYGADFSGVKSPYRVGDRTLLAKTCPRCGLLLARKWFSRRGDGTQGLQTYCIRCRPSQDRREQTASKRKEEGGNKSAQKFHAQVQAITRARATRHGQEWVEADHEVLRNPEMTILAKALRLGRTYSAVSQQCSKNRYESLVGWGDPIKGQWVIDNPNETGCAA